MNIILYKALFWHHLLYIFLKPCRQQAYFLTAAGAKTVQSCPTLCDSIDGSPPGSPFPGILQARTLEWVATAFSNAWKWKVKSLSLVWLFATPWTAAHQAPPSLGFSRQEYWSGLPLPSPCFLTRRSSIFKNSCFSLDMIVGSSRQVLSKMDEI